MNARSIGLAFCVAITGYPPGAARGQPNSWINPASANWQTPTSWSLGVLPSATQSIFITNSGFKAVGISPSTVAGFSASLQVASLTISAPTNGLNTLLLNFSGTTVPLRLAGNCTLGTNGSLVNLSSGFEMDGGTLELDGGSFVEQGGVSVGTNVPVAINAGLFGATNALLSFGTLTNLGTVRLSGCSFTLNQAYDWGLIEQTAGTNSFSTIFLGSTTNSIGFTPHGDYVLHSGLLSGNTLVAGFNGFATFTQEAGAVRVPKIDFSGGYNLMSGSLVSTQLTVGANGADGSFQHSNGVVSTITLALGSPPAFKTPAHGSYNLSNGTVSTVHTIIGNGGGAGGFGQFGGAHVITNDLVLAGTLETVNIEVPSTYDLEAGTLTAGNETINPISFVTERGGSNLVSGNLLLNGALFHTDTNYILEAGTLVTSNTMIAASLFHQSGGVHIVRSSLSLNPLSNFSSLYNLGGGTLVASNIDLAGTLQISGASSLSNAGAFRLNGVMTIQGKTLQLGNLTLAGNSKLDLVGSGNSVRFLPSSANVWSNAAVLAVTNWNGSTSGGGADQLFIGSSSAGLSQSQLNQIQFNNPAGFAPGVYSANILSTGEIVPAPAVSIAFARLGNNFVLTWPDGLILQSSTNIAGPFSDVPGAVSGYSESVFAAPQKFFRLRQ